MNGNFNIIFGPVPSRRLGKSLGINNIPPKICSYSCIYCQLGKNTEMTADRRIFYNPDEIFEKVSIKVEAALNKGEKIDYITFVSDGEPTLDVNLKSTILKLKKLGFPVAVISNSSLIFMDEVKEALWAADLVSLKVDTAEEDIWKKINRPHRQLDLNLILKSILDFSKNYKGILLTETMLIKNINEDEKHIEKTAEFLSQLNIQKHYLSIPIRPPAEKYAEAPSAEKINLAYQIMRNKIKKDNVEYIINSEGNDFAFAGDIEADILGIVSVHPMPEEALNKLLIKAGASWHIVEKLIKCGKITETIYKDKKFYLRKFV